MGDEQPSSPIEHLSAVTLLTADMARSWAFYDGVGFETIYGGADSEFTSYRCGPTGPFVTYLNVGLDAGFRLAGIWGRTIVWVADVDATYERIRSLGVEPQFAPSDALWGERYFHVRDPDGHELSFARRLS